MERRNASNISCIHFQYFYLSLHAYIKSLKTSINTTYFTFQSLHKAYIIPTQSLHTFISLANKNQSVIYHILSLIFFRNSLENFIARTNPSNCALVWKLSNSLENLEVFIKDKSRKTVIQFSFPALQTLKHPVFSWFYVGIM